MALTLNTYPAAECFSSMLGDLNASTTGTRVNVTVTLDSATLFSETYYPVSGHVVLYDLRSIVEPLMTPGQSASLSVALSEETLNSQTGVYTTTDTETVASTVYLCRAELNMAPSTFFSDHFATLMQGPKRTTMERKENIWYYSTAGGETPVVTGQYYSGGAITTHTFTLTAQSGAGYHEVDASAANYTQSGKRLLRYVVAVGNRRQTFTLDHTEQEGSPALAFRNAFGLYEPIYCRGVETAVHNYDRQSATFIGQLRNYRIDEVVERHADTGPIPPMEQDWATDLFRSTDVRLLENGVLGKAVTLTDSQVQRDDSDDSLIRYTFTYRLSQRNQCVLPVPGVTSIFDATFDPTFN